MVTGSFVSNKDTIEEIKNRVDIASLIGGYVNLRKSGHNYLGLCPFHSEKTPSFYVSPESKSYHCFGCGTHGDIFSFWMATNNINFKEALSQLADRAGIQIKQPAKKKISDSYQKLYNCLSAANNLFQKHLQESPPAINYLKERNINASTIQTFQLGFAPQQWQWLYKNILSININQKTMLDVGLIKKSSADKIYDFFSNRLIFPINNHLNQTIAFAGRRLDDQLPKYINSPDSLLYKKNKTLYGVPQAMSFWQKTKRAIIVEGYFDVLRLHQNGFGEAVASCGTALTIQQLQFIKYKGIKNIYLLLDNDQAGIKATLNTIPLIFDADLQGKVITLPADNDPDSFFNNHSPDDMTEIINQASNAQDYILNHFQKIWVKADVDTKASIINRLSSFFSQDSLKNDVWISTISNTFGITKSSIQTNRKKSFSLPNLNTPTAKISANKKLLTLYELQKLNRAFKDEFDLLRMLFISKEAFTIIKKNVPSETIKLPIIKHFYEQFIKLEVIERNQLDISGIQEIFSDYNQLCGYISQTVFYENWLTSLDNLEIESRIYNLLHKSILSQSRQNISQCTNSDEHAVLVKKREQDIAQIQHLNHKK